MALRALKPIRTMVVVLGDQLNDELATFDQFDSDQDVIVQMEVKEEATYIPQHKLRIAFFFAAMRHFRDEQTRKGRTVHYSEIGDPDNRQSIAAEVRRSINQLQPKTVLVTEPGDWRVKRALEGQGVTIVPDTSFLCSTKAFSAFLEEHPRPIMETFYRHMRRQTGYLMDRRGQPVGKQWNFDRDNRSSYSRNSPAIPKRRSFAPDDVTRKAIADVLRHFQGSPGTLASFDLPVTRDQALRTLRDFIGERLPSFGKYQDAIVEGEYLLFHSHLSGALNLHLLNAKEVLDASLDASSDVPLNSLEGFVRQILGWREFVRGIYWAKMPTYADENALEADLSMPRFYWTGATDMRCLAEAISHTIAHAYAHHIERLMVLGLYALLLGVRPYDVHRWHMSMFLDAIDWVSLPNTLGMSQHGDGGVIGTKPYVASGSYINRMSNHCGKCRYKPTQAIGDDACPFTTLYWDFLDRHRTRFSRNPRMQPQYRNLDRKSADEMRAIRHRANNLKARAI
ncbi:MAG: deoxyribodipyrimidine photolyase [Proteobacteria bacterium SG_bin9]|nr:MAG: deoxyribodipyrimidine photolyase [Proteobacteria bacterium SG_bin9]